MMLNFIYNLITIIIRTKLFNLYLHLTKQLYSSCTGDDIKLTMDMKILSLLLLMFNPDFYLFPSFLP